MSTFTPIQLVYRPAAAQAAQERRIQRRITKDAEQNAKKETIAAKKQMRRGVLGSLASLTEEISHAVSSGVSNSASSIMDRYQSNKFFQERFGSFLPTETLWDAAAFCRVTSGETAVTGAVFVSTNHVSFYGYVSRSQVLQFSIPLSGIASIQRAVTMRRGNAGMPPLLQVVPNPTVDTDAVLIYTTDGLVHQFHSFARTKTMENFINIIDHAWRAVLASRGSQVFVDPVARPAVMAPAAAASKPVSLT